MSFTTESYPDVMDDLSPQARNRAIKIANDLLTKGMNEDQAVVLAVDRAKKLTPPKSSSS